MILNLFIKNKHEVSWETEPNGTINNIPMNDDGLAIYLAPHLLTVIKTAKINIKSNSDMLLSAVEDKLIDEFENYYATLLSSDSDDFSYIAVIDKMLYTSITKHKIISIQSIAHITDYQANLWTLHLQKNNSFLRISIDEYFMLDDDEPIPAVLHDMLKIYTMSEILVYSDDQSQIEYIKKTYHLNCIVANSFDYTSNCGNIYTKFQFNSGLINKFIYTGKLIVCVGIGVLLISLLNVSILLYQKHKISSILSQKQIEFNDKSIKALYNTNSDISHKNGDFAQDDFLPLLERFLAIVPYNKTIVAIHYEKHSVSVFLSDTPDINYILFATNGMYADITDYKKYKTTLTLPNTIKSVVTIRTLSIDNIPNLGQI